MQNSIWPPPGVDWYYSDEFTAIANADCRDVLPQLEPVDLVLTDPPYGIDYAPKYARRKLPNGKWMEPSEMPAVIGDKKEFDPSFLLASGKRLILWGANHYAHKLPHRGQWLVWDKRCQIVPPRNQSDCEIAWHSKPGADRIFYHLWDGMLKASERGVSRQHPTQKAEVVMRWCLGFFPEAKTILDPFMGSGTTLRAAKDLGLKSIGVEIERKYCDIAIERLRQQAFSFEAAL